MPRSARLHKERKPEVIKALERNGFLTQGDLAAHLEVALSTVNNFINSRPVSIAKFEEICTGFFFSLRRKLTEWKLFSESDDKENNLSFLFGGN